MMDIIQSGVRRSGQYSAPCLIHRDQQRSKAALHITFDLYERIVDLCGWPRG